MAYDNAGDFIPIGAQRLLALADVLETIPDEQYDQGTFKSEICTGENRCGTTACALGWGMLKIPEVIGLRLDDHGYIVDLETNEPRADIGPFLMERFDLDYHELNMFGGWHASAAFYGHEQSEAGWKAVSTKQVAAKIREFALSKVVKV